VNTLLHEEAQKEKTRDEGKSSAPKGNCAVAGEGGVRVVSAGEKDLNQPRELKEVAKAAWGLGAVRRDVFAPSPGMSLFKTENQY